MRILSTLGILALVAFHLTSATGQNIRVELNDQLLEADTIAQLTSFSGKCYSEKNYLKWTIANQHTDGVFMIYRSTDSINYEKVGDKQGIGVPISNEIAYYFVDTIEEIHPAYYYRIIHVSSASLFLTSKRIAVYPGISQLATIE